MAANTFKSFTTKLVEQAKSDPKKASVLAGLVVVMAFTSSRMIGGMSGGATKAVASVTAFHAGGPADNVTAPGGPSATAAALQEWARRPLGPLSRNLFVVNYDFFPQDGSRPTSTAVQGGVGFWDRVGKSMAVRADQKREHEALVDNLRRQAEQLKVQSTMMGASPKALINGELVGVGSVVASFRVTKIEARRIVVEREGIRLEVRSN
jgi:hypothetical protein